MAGIIFGETFSGFSTISQLTRRRWSAGITLTASGSDQIVSSGGPLNSAYLELNFVSNAFDRGRTLRRTLGGAKASASCGFHFRITGISTQCAIVEYMDSSTQQFDIRISTAGVLTATRNGTVIGTAGSTISFGVDHHLQVEATIHNTTGALKVVLDGTTTLLNLTNVNTRNGTNNQATHIGIGTMGGTGGTCRFANFYCTDDFSEQGVLKGVYGTVSANGTYGDFTASTGTRASCVDDTSPNDDTDYNSSTTVGHKDTFTVTGLSGITTGATIKGYQVSHTHRVDDAGSHTIRAVLYSGSTVGEGSDVSPASSYETSEHFFQNDPNTGSAFTRSAALAAEIGYKNQA